MKKFALSMALAAALLAGYAGYVWRAEPPPTPHGQLSLTDIGARGLPAFERMFDDAADRVRVVALLSPT